MSDKHDETVKNTPLEYLVAGLVILVFGLLYYFINHGWGWPMQPSQDIPATSEAAAIIHRSDATRLPSEHLPSSTAGTSTQVQTTATTQAAADQASAATNEPTNNLSDPTATEDLELPSNTAQAQSTQLTSETPPTPENQAIPQNESAMSTPEDPSQQTLQKTVETMTDVTATEAQPTTQISNTSVTQTPVMAEHYYLPDGSEVMIAESGFENDLKQAFLNQDANQSLVFDNISFNVGSAQLDPKSLPQIRATAALLNTYKSRQVLIRGHSDNTGSINVNSLLSLERSDSMKNALVKLGIDERRIKIEGVGPQEPIASNDTAEGRQKNRRIELRLLK